MSQVKNKLKKSQGKDIFNFLGTYKEVHQVPNITPINTIKVSYSCMPNIKAEIHKHNKNTQEKAQQKHPNTQICNCTNKKHCPLNGQRLTESIVYQANIMANVPGYKEKFTLVYPKQHLKFAMVTTKNRLQNNVAKTTPNYPRSVGR